MTNHDYTDDVFAANIEREFEYQRPTPEKQLRFDRIKKATKALLHEINSCCPNGANKDRAYQLAVDIRMRANAAIALHKDEEGHDNDS